MIEQLLDQLAEWQAQADLLEMDKRRLLDEVKIPAEVLAAQDEANKARQALDSDAFRIQKEIQTVTAQLMGEVKDPEMPPEFVAALAAARAQRDDIQSQATSRYEQLAKVTAEKKAQVDAALTAKTQDVYAQVAQRKLDISAEFDDKSAGLLDNIAKLTTQIKAETVKEGKTVKGKHFMAVYNRGRITWNTDMMEAWINDHPFLNAARKEGKPSISLRKI